MKTKIFSALVISSFMSLTALAGELTAQASQMIQPSTLASLGQIELSPAAQTIANNLQIKIPPKVSLAVIGKYKILPPIHILPIFGDHPVVHQLGNMYQLDQRYVDLFSPTNGSEICGPTALGNSIQYLRKTRSPAFPNLLQSSVPASVNSDDNTVRALFNLCSTSRDNGTLMSKMLDCTNDAISEGKYLAGDTHIIGYDGGAGNYRSVQPADMKNASAADQGVTVLVGWYTEDWDATQNAFVYHRVGGHYVALAGYDQFNSTVFYVSNPLVDYSNTTEHYSKITLEKIPDSAQVKTPGNMKGLWQTRDLVGGSLAVIEDILITDPKLNFIVKVPPIMVPPIKLPPTKIIQN